MALQHLRSSTANKRPVPGNMSEGQLGINTNDGSPGLFFKDSNNALVKVGPVHVGTTAPNASPANGGTAGNSVGEQWLDTSGGTYVFKVWDGSAWRSESGVFVRAAANATVGVEITNTESSGYSQLNLRNSGGTAKEYQIVVGGSSSLSANNFWLYDATAGVVRVHVSSTGNIGINTTNPQYLLDVSGSVVQFGASTDAFVQYKSSAGNWHVGANSANAYVFYSGTYGSGTEFLRVTQNGYLRLSAGSPGIQFNGDTAAANALNDYEEGTFTPTIVGTTSAGTGTYTNQIGRYTKIGDRVTFTIYLNWTAHTGTGNIRVSNLPFTSTSATGSFHAASIYADGIPFTGPWLQAYVDVNSTNIGMGQMTAAGVVSGISMDSAGDITITGHYEV